MRVWAFDSERDEEGDLLREVTANGVVNVAQYYHHETVRIHETDDDIRSNVRGGLDVTRAANHRPERSMPPSSITAGAPLKGRSISAASQKRSSGHTDAPYLPANDPVLRLQQRPAVRHCKIGYI
ncbi:hypothetical protein EDB81DRAFT_893997 [Dactylonectria macrodidyma]|uniref:Fungal-type protein kinase domain-containing protein n=1 Tax=Dactylonectria macrodidyma TaxID=307937 RepID=A0A9P9D4B1_9HYPO|nr:hypothetical protein EDB81DRAFT_893997 [Dactylonectria macrodidyma]